MDKGVSGFCFGISMHWMVKCVAKDISKLLNLVD